MPESDTQVRSPGFEVGVPRFRRPMNMARLAPSLLQFIELTLIMAALAAIAFASRHAGLRNRRPAGFGYIESRFRCLARRKTLSLAVVGLLVFALRLSFIPVLGIPAPRWN